MLRCAFSLFIYMALCIGYASQSQASLCPTNTYYNNQTQQCECPEGLVHNTQLDTGMVHLGSCHALLDLLPLSSMELWLDADDLDTLTWSTADLRVSTWNDKSGNFNHATDSTPGLTADQPILMFSAKSDRHALSFTTDTELEGNIASITGDTSLTIFMVKQHTLSDAVDRISFSLGTDASHIDIGTQPDGIPGDPPNNYLFEQSNGSTAAASGDEDWHVHTLIRNGSNLLIYIDGQLEVTAARTAQSITGAFFVGRSQSLLNNDYFRGSIGEIIVFNTALNASYQETIETYLGQKWGISMN